MTTAERRRRRVRVRVGVGIVLAALLAVGLAAFEPWLLFVDTTVEQAPPSAVSSTTGETPEEPVVIARGELITHEHETSGTALVLELPDGSRVLRLENLATSNGPLLRVFLSDQPVLPGDDGWYVFDDGAFADLGDLAGNIGSSNYPIPADVDLAALSSVSIWCDRFDVSFGAAVLEPVAAPEPVADADADTLDK